MTTPYYNRAPSPHLQELLMPGGPLSWLVELNERKISGRAFDVHFRSGGEVHVYHGGTRLLKVERLKWPKGYVTLTANDEYKKQPCAKGLFRRRRIDDPKLREAAEAYLRDVKIGPRWTEGEGAIQMLWSRVTKPWTPFDREAVLGGASTQHQQTAKVDAALDELMDIYTAHQHAAGRKRWAKPKKSGKEVDQLAVDSDRRLVLIEIKDASNRTAEVYYAPFQLLQYIWEWHGALGAVGADLHKLIDARVAVGLTPPGVTRLTGGIRAAVGFGPDSRSNEVRRRYGIVLGIVNKHLPPGVGPIETWSIAESVPRRVA